MLIKFRSAYRGAADYDVFGRDAKRHAVVTKTESKTSVSLTEFGEQAQLSEGKVLAEFAEFEAGEHARFLEWCKARNIDPALAS